MRTILSYQTGTNLINQRVKCFLEEENIYKSKVGHTHPPFFYLSTKGKLDRLYVGPAISVHLAFPLQGRPYSEGTTTKCIEIVVPKTLQSNKRCLEK